MKKGNKIQLDTRKNALKAELNKLSEYILFLIANSEKCNASEMALQQFRLIEGLLRVNYYTRPSKNSNILSMIRFVNSSTNYSNDIHYWQMDALVILNQQLLLIDANVSKWVNVGQYPNNPIF